MNNNSVKPAYSLYHELANAMPKMAELLGCEEVVIDTKFRVDPFESLDLLPIAHHHLDLPAIQLRPSHSFDYAYPPFLGFNIYKLDDVVFGCYASYDARATYQTYLVCPKGKVFRTYRAAWRKLKEKHKEVELILDDKFFNDVKNNTLKVIKHWRTVLKYGVSLKRGLIFSGNPGNGKSLTCNYIKTEAGRRGWTCNEVSSQELKAEFQKGNDIAHFFTSANIIFFDDVDISYLSERTNASDSGLACAILSALDGIDKDSDVCIRIFTTNEDIDGFDPAFLRPGRIDRIFKFENPTTELRQQLVETWNKEIIDYLEESQQYDTFIEKDTEGWSFAEIDAIKSCLVTNKIIDGSWNLTKAIEESSPKKIRTKTIGLGRMSA